MFKLSFLQVAAFLTAAPHLVLSLPTDLPTGVSCPASNGETVALGADSFAINCGIDYYGGDLALSWESSFQNCITTCHGTAGCVSVSYNGAACYMKSTTNSAVENSNVWAAKKVVAGPSSSSTISSTTSTSTVSIPSSIACPASDSQTVTIGSHSFQVQCGTDYYGGDLALSWEDTFSKCLNTCENTAGCIAVSYHGHACYMKSSNNGASANSAVWAAKKVASGVSSSSSVSSSTTSSSPATSTSATSSSIACPASDQSIYTAKNGMAYRIECSADRYGEDLDIAWVPSLEGCINACEAHTGCVDVSFRFPTEGNDGPCYLKKSYEQKVLVDAGIYGALRIGPQSSSTVSVSSTTTSSSTTSSSTTSLLSTTQPSTLSTSSTATSSSSLSSTPSSTASSTTSSTLSSSSSSTTTTTMTTTTTTTTTTSTTTTSTVPTQVVVNGAFESIGKTTPPNMLPWTDSVATTGGKIDLINGVRATSQNPTYTSGPDLGIIRVYPPTTAGLRYTSIFNTIPVVKSTTYQLSFMYRCLNFDTNSGIEAYFAGRRIMKATCPPGNSAVFNKTVGNLFTTDASSSSGQLEIRFLNPTGLPYLYYYADEFFATRV